MKIKGYLFSQTSAGPVETAHELGEVATGTDQHPWLVYCDVLALDEFSQPIADDNSVAVASLIEKWIEEALNQASGRIDEETLSEALSHANRRLLQRDCQEIHQVAVSAVVLSLVPRRDGGEGQEILIAGVGDSKVFLILPQRVETVFADPQNRNVASDLNTADRLYSLTNALGVREEVTVHTRRLLAGNFQRFAVVSYGLYQQIQEKELLALGLRPHDDENGAGPTLSSKQPRGHVLSVYTATFGSLQDSQQKKIEAEAPPPHTVRRKQRKQRRAIAGLAVATTAIIAGLGAMLLVDKPTKSPESEQVAEAQPTTQDQAALQSERTNLQADHSLLATLEEQNRIQAETITTLRHHLHEARKRIKQVEQGPTEAYDRKVAELRTELLEARQQLQARQAAGQRATASADESTQRITHLEHTIGTLEEVIAQQKKAHDQEVTELTAQLEAFRNTPPSKPEVLVTTDPKVVKELRQQLKEAQDQVSLLQTQQQQLQQEQATLAAKAEEASSRYHSERSAASSLEDKLRELQDLPFLLEQERQRNGTLAAKLRESTEQLREKEALFAKGAQDSTQVRIEQEKLFAQVQELRAAVDTYQEYEKRYNNERKLRLEKEQRLAQLMDGIEQQKQWLARIDQSRSKLETELAQVRQDYANLAAGKVKVETPPSYQHVATTPPPQQESREVASLEPSESGVRVHLVSRGESLSSISLRYYGTGNKWQQIYEANRGSISDINNIRVGTALVIP